MDFLAINRQEIFMQRAKQGPQQDKPDTPARTGGLPVAKDATQLNQPRRTGESPGDRDDHLGGHNQNRERQGR